jgi:hypothetical protein
VSVVVAARDAGGVTREALHAVGREAAGLDAEVLVVAPSGSREAELARDVAPVLEVAGDPLVPDLWKAGIDATTGELVAVTIAQCVPAPGWLPALVGALDPLSVAAGGPVVLRSRRPVVTAAFYLRYSSYRRPFSRREALDVPGDNAIYRRSALDAVRDVWRHGFWENEVNVALRARGETLVLDPRPVVALRTVGGFRAFWRQRVRHGRVFGAWRAATGAGRWRAVLAPLVPLGMLTRIVRRVPSGERLRFAVALPFLVAFVLAWVAGETIGLLLDHR